MKILTWLRCSAENLHLWNYLWAIQPLTELAKTGETFLMLADLHSLTTVHNGAILKKNKEQVLLDYFSLIPQELLESDKFFIFEQSKVEHLMDIVWALTSVTPYSLILRSHAFKDSQTKNADINMAVFNYSILMTADIITYDIDKVPVGKDQQQHIEFARDIAAFFNETYGKEIFKLPSWKIADDVGLIPWLDGRKMSKSYNNYIGVFEDEKTMKKKIMSIPTDATPLEEPKNPDTCNVFNLIKLFAPKKRTADIKKKYLAGWYGYWHAKLELLEILLEYTKDFRERRAKLEKDPSSIHAILERWNKKANMLAEKKYKQVMEVVGL
jgi:tryptophanyl-tRNA synthetase